ncbi:hypothetical protein E6O75_ATG05952 [Venturia nashicola]|uniref:BTB domain-containing protein n=1 Tax=Venturia nashicola TaxID=86259 RepID=A0A4Z1PB54_9PEZI|nr:hypothetical protein E6O75_ATG05952 [Venturia nashicola]
MFQGYGLTIFGKRISRVFVGKDTEPYIIHHDLLSASSDFFDKALNGRFKESGGDVYLPKQKSETFDAYQRWLYSGKIDMSGQTLSKALWLSCQYYLLGDTIQDEGFRNAAIDNILDHVASSQIFPADLSYVQKVYHSTAKGSILRKLVVDFWLFGSDPGWFDKFEDQGFQGEFPSEFWFEVSRGLVKQRVEKSQAPSLYPWVSNRCQYHHHKKTLKCT